LRIQCSPILSVVFATLRTPVATFERRLTARGFNRVSHSLRKTTAAMLVEAGLSARVIADRLGHARPSMTQDVYMGHKVVDARVADALEDALGKTTPSESSAKKSE
jgi:integrase